MHELQAQGVYHVQVTVTGRVRNCQCIVFAAVKGIDATTVQAFFLVPLAIVRGKVPHAWAMLVQEEYAREGIDWSYVEFIDNQDCLDVLEGSQDLPSLAVFPLIDEACRLPRATYQVCLTCQNSYQPRSVLDKHAPPPSHGLRLNCSCLLTLLRSGCDSESGKASPLQGGSALYSFQ